MGLEVRFEHMRIPPVLCGKVWRTGDGGHRRGKGMVSLPCQTSTLRLLQRKTMRDASTISVSCRGDVRPHGGRWLHGRQRHDRHDGLPAL